MTLHCLHLCIWTHVLYLKIQSDCQMFTGLWSNPQLPESSPHMQNLSTRLQLLSSPAADNKSHSCVCRLWSLSACDFQHVLMRTISVTYGDASSHSPTWLILSSLPLCTDDISQLTASKFPNGSPFTVKHVIWPCHPVKPKYCALLVKRGQETGELGISGCVL